MKKIIYILVLSLFIFNCSKSDDDTCNTFLECNDGSTWILNYDFSSVSVLYRINNNIKNPFEQWIIFDGEDCYYQGDFEADFDFTITENTKDKLVINIDLGGGDSETATFSIVNGELKEIYSQYISGESYEEILIFQETTIDVDNLTICP